MRWSFPPRSAAVTSRSATVAAGSTAAAALGARFVDAHWRYERIEGASHWIPYDAPDRLAALLTRHWEDAAFDA